jgi:hypothetical protein
MYEPSQYWKLMSMSWFFMLSYSFRNSSRFGMIFSFTCISFLQLFDIVIPPDIWQKGCVHCLIFTIWSLFARVFLQYMLWSLWSCFFGVEDILIDFQIIFVVEREECSLNTFELFPLSFFGIFFLSFDFLSLYHVLLQNIVHIFSFAFEFFPGH